MGHLRTVNEAVPSTPAASSMVLFSDSTALEYASKDASGNVKTLRPLTNYGVTTTAGALIYIVGSNLLVPPQLVRVGTQFIWHLTMSKTAACTSAPIYRIYGGTTATTASDTQLLTWTQGTNQTANADTAMLIVTATVKTAGASGILTGGYALITKSSATAGFSATTGCQNDGPLDSAAFNMTTASLQFGLAINPGNTGANAVWTIMCQAMMLNV